MNYAIGQFSAITKISSYTLRYYEKEELLIVSRDAAGRRFYTTADVDWILFIKKLKDTGMSIKDIKEYSLLRYQGDSTMQQRLEILEKHKVFVAAEVAKWNNHLQNLDEKIKIYQGKLDLTH
jgi:DNA-binding transcriptional MerR regulator